MNRTGGMAGINSKCVDVLPEKASSAVILNKESAVLPKSESIWSKPLSPMPGLLHFATLLESK